MRHRRNNRRRARFRGARHQIASTSVESPRKRRRMNDSIESEETFINSIFNYQPIYDHNCPSESYSGFMNTFDVENLVSNIFYSISNKESHFDKICNYSPYSLLPSSISPVRRSCSRGRRRRLHWRHQLSHRRNIVSNRTLSRTNVISTNRLNIRKRGSTRGRKPSRRRFGSRFGVPSYRKELLSSNNLEASDLIEPINEASEIEKKDFDDLSIDVQVEEWRNKKLPLTVPLSKLQHFKFSSSLYHNVSPQLPSSDDFFLFNRYKHQYSKDDIYLSNFDHRNFELNRVPSMGVNMKLRRYSSPTRLESSRIVDDTSSNAVGCSVVEALRNAAGSVCAAIERKVRGKHQNEKHALYRVGDLIWGKLFGFNWWPGMIAYIEDRERAHYWVRWFGDNMFSGLTHYNVRPLTDFNELFSQKRYRRSTNYREAVNSAILEAAQRVKHTNDLSPVFLLSWANDQFKPYGEKILSAPPKQRHALCNEFSVHEKWHDYYLAGTKTKWVHLLSKQLPARRDLFSGLKVPGDLISMCIACGDSDVRRPHPIFIGGFCDDCLEEMAAEMCGTTNYCTVCSDSAQLKQCSLCLRHYCVECLNLLTHSIELNKCAICEGGSKSLLQLRVSWQMNLHEVLHQGSSYNSFSSKSYSYCNVLAFTTQPLTIWQALKKAGIHIKSFVSFEITYDEIFVSRVSSSGICSRDSTTLPRLLTETHLEEFSQVNLLLCSTEYHPSLSNSCPIYEYVCIEFFNSLRVMSTLKYDFIWIFHVIIAVSNDLAFDHVPMFFKKAFQLAKTNKEMQYVWSNIPSIQLCSLPNQSRTRAMANILSNVFGSIKNFYSASIHDDSV